MEDNVVFLSLKVFKSDYAFLKKKFAKDGFLEKPQLKIISLQNYKQRYLFHT